MSEPVLTSSPWDAAVEQLKRLLDDLAEQDPRTAQRPVKGTAGEAGNPAAAGTPTQGFPTSGVPAAPVTTVPPPATVPPMPVAAGTPASPPIPGVAASFPKLFDAKHLSALLAALAGMGISGGSIWEAVQKRLARAPREHWLLAIIVVGGLVAAFFALRFVLQRIHRNHAGFPPDAAFFGTWKRILTSRRVLGLIVAVVGTLAAGAGSTMIYQRSGEPAAAQPAAAESPANASADPGQPGPANPAGTATVQKTATYGVAGAGIVAMLGGLLMVYRRTFPEPKVAAPAALPAASALVMPALAPAERTVSSAPPSAAETTGTAPPAAESVDDPVLEPFEPGDPAAVLFEQNTIFTWLRDLFELDSFACNVVFLTVACEADADVAAGCARLQGGSSFPRAGLAVALFRGPAPGAANEDSRAAKVAAFAADAPLRAWRLIETFQPEGRNLLGATIKADEPILQLLLGHASRDERLQRFRAPLAPDAITGPIAQSQWEVTRGFAPRLRGGELCELRGNDPVSKQLVALAAHGWRPGNEGTTEASTAAHAFGRQTLERVPCSSLPKEQDDIAQVAKLWQRQCRLFGGALYVDAEDAETPEQVAALRLFLRCLLAVPVASANFAANSPPVFVATAEALPDLGVPQFTVAVAKPSRLEQEDQWKQLVKDEGAASQLADEFNFNLPTITRLHGVSDGGIAGVRITCRQSHQSRLDALAQRIVPVADWDTLVLPDFQKNLLRALTDQVRCRGRVYRRFGFAETMNRGFGISALFTGESGTGKTTAAEVIAADLGYDLYRIDLSAVVDKYVGVTEKKLRSVFDAAEEGGVALFFDECDAIFGRRSEVKDSHDRYANIQINYLLQRLENFGGLAILATNQGDAIDQAFLRRLRFIVNFPMPDRALRREIWEHVFPPRFLKEVPCAPPFGDALFDALAETPLSGGQIHAVALNAAFLAARETPPRLSLRMIEHAMDAEFLKTGSPLRHTTFPAAPEPMAEEPAPFRNAA